LKGFYFSCFNLKSKLYLKEQEKSLFFKIFMKSFLKKTFGGILTLFLLFGILNYFHWTDSIKNIFFKSANSVQKPFFRVGSFLKDFGRSIFSFSQLKKDQEELVKENQKLLLQLADLEKLKSENESLKKALGVIKSENFKLIFAHFVGFDLNSDYAFIDEGSLAGVKNHLPLINEQKVLIGRVIEVFPQRARIRFLWSPESLIPAKVLGKDAFGLVKGNGNFEAFLEEVPREKKLEKGDLVLTSNFDKSIPANLLIGKILDFEKNDIEPFQKAKIELLAKPEKLESVFVISEP
jgi:rod shape-determining protein MreC